MLNIPDPQAVMCELAPTLERVWGSLEWGTLKTREYFDSLELSPDSDLAPQIVRFHAKRTLAAAQPILLGDSAEDWSLRYLRGNGLMLRVGIYKVRILKVSTIYDGKLPAPGFSRMRQLFWNANRQLVLALEFPSSAEHPPILNLIVLWETDSHFNLSKLYLACPKAGGKRIDSARAYWIEEVPRFGTGLLQSGANPPLPETDPETDNDLDITLPDLSETGTDEPNDQ
jgi:hypothetical protein